VQSKNNEVKRVVPHENNSVNECWISDRDRFSYEGLNSNKRLTEPMIKASDGQWHAVSWEEALAKVSLGLKQAANHGPNQVRTLLSPNSTLEEMTLAALLTRALKSDSVDFRLRLGEAGFDQRFDGTPTLGISLDALSLSDFGGGLVPASGSPAIGPTASPVSATRHKDCADSFDGSEPLDSDSRAGLVFP